MKPRHLQLALAITLAAIPCLPESGYVNVLVEDARKHPVPLVEIGIEKGASKLTKDDGKAQLPLAQSIKADDWISVQLVHSPPGKDLAIVSPWDNRIPVPSFADKSENLIKIVVVQRGDRAALESGAVLASLTAKINKANAPKSANLQEQPDPKEALLAVAKQYDLSPEDIDTAIRAWGTKATDPYEQALVFLYEHNYPKATAAFEDSLNQRKQQLAVDQKKVIQDQKNIADAACFLGQSLYGEGRYRESAKAYQECLNYRPDDPIVLNNLALSFHFSGDYSAAEPLYRRALAIDEKLPDLDQSYLATDINNLALLLKTKGNFAAAEPLYKRALAIDEKTLGPHDPAVARDRNNLAELYREQGRYDEAEPLFKRAIAIDEKALGPHDPAVARDVGNLALLLDDRGDLDAAEPLYRRALAIDEKAVGPDHPYVATDLNNLASFLQEKGDLDAAAPLYRRAITIDEKALGSDHPDVARDLGNLASLLQSKGDYTDAELYYSRALAIYQKAFGPDHPETRAIQKALTDLQNHATTAPH